MTRIVAAQTSLSAGEFSPLLHDRNDLDAWQSGAAIIENMIPRLEGPLAKRAGTVFVTAPKTSATPCRLMPFIKSFGDGVMVEAGNNYMRFIDAEAFAYLLDTGVPVEIVTTYGDSYLDYLRTFQSADVMWITDRTGVTTWRRLVRYADDDWDIADFEYRLGPFFNRNDVTSTVSINPSGTAVDAAITLTGVNYTFDENQVGGLMRIWNGFGGYPYPKWEAGATISAGQYCEYGGRVYQDSGAGGTAGNQPPVHDYGAITDGGVSWVYKHDMAGVARITGKSSASWPAQIVNATVEEAFPATGASTDFAEGCFSDYRGWPRLGAIFDERMIATSTLAQPDTVFLARTGEYSPDNASFKAAAGNGEVLDTDAVQRTIASGTIDIPAWIVPTQEILIGTPSGIKRVTGPSIDEAITPSGIAARLQPGSIGAALDVDAVFTGLAVLYAGRGARRLIEYPIDGSPSRDLTVRASHMGAARFKEFAWCQEPYGRLFALRRDGRLRVLVYDRASEMNAWASIVLGGVFEDREPVIESIAAAPDGEGRDRLWLAVKRTIDGATSRTIEILAPDFEAVSDLPEAQIGVDAGVVLDLWNTDTSKTITLTADADAVAGDAVTLAATGHTPFAGGTVGTELRLRATNRPALASDAPGDVAVLIESVGGGGSTASGLLVRAPASGHVGVALVGWAWPVSTMTGLDHLEGESVQLWLDGEDGGDAVVASGAVNFPGSAVHAVAGLGFNWRARTLPLAGQGRRGDSRGDEWAGEKLAIGYISSGPARVRFITDEFEEVSDPLGGRRNEDLIGAPVPLRTSIEKVTLESHRASRLQAEIFGDRPSPFMLSFMAAKVSVDDDD